MNNIETSSDKMIIPKESTLSVVFKGQKYYRMSEVCQIVGVGRSTLWRWLRTGVLEDSMKRDRHGWRIFTESDITRIENEAKRVE
jgi:hypothetical protein